MTKCWLYSMVILWSSYGDSMVMVVFYHYFGCKWCLWRFFGMERKNKENLPKPNDINDY